MTALIRVQEDFQALLLGRESGIDAHVVGTARVSIATRLGIYSDGYCSRLIEALQANFPALAKLLDEDFAALGTAYVRANDSTFRSIRYYGAGLADFLAEHADYAQAPILAELARWEWAMTEVFDAADEAPLAPSVFSQIEPSRWGDLQFRFHPSVRRLDLKWNAPQMWKALTEEAERPQAAVLDEPVPWLLWRNDLQTFFRSLEGSEAAALDLARRSATFGEICTTLGLHFAEDEVPVRAITYLRTWLQAGILTAVH
jgi:hypothetical protein